MGPVRWLTLVLPLPGGAEGAEKNYVRAAELYERAIEKGRMTCVRW